MKLSQATHTLASFHLTKWLIEIRDSLFQFSGNQDSRQTDGTHKQQLIRVAMPVLMNSPLICRMVLLVKFDSEPLNYPFTVKTTWLCFNNHFNTVDYYQHRLHIHLSFDVFLLFTFHMNIKQFFKMNFEWCFLNPFAN